MDTFTPEAPNDSHDTSIDVTGDTSEPPPDPPFGSSVIPMTDGYVIVSYTHKNPIEYPDYSQITAEFWTTSVYTPISSTVGILPTQLDTCAGSTYTLDELVGDGVWEAEGERGGTVTFSGPQGSFALQPANNWGLASHGHAYWAQLDENAFVFNSDWTVEGEGDEFPAFNFPEIHIPRDLTVQSPSILGDWELTDGPLLVEWTGGDLNLSVVLRLTVSSSGLYGRAVCEVRNDGEFEIPASLINTFPSGYASLTVEQVRREIREARERPVRVEALVNTIIVGVR